VTGEIGRTCWRQPSQRSISSPDGPGRAPPGVGHGPPAPEGRPRSSGVPVGPLGLSRDPAADPPFAAGERVATGVDLHLQAVAALKDWWPLSCGFWRPGGTRTCNLLFRACFRPSTGFCRYARGGVMGGDDHHRNLDHQPRSAQPTPPAHKGIAVGARDIVSPCRVVLKREAGPPGGGGPASVPAG
jgi:hypothetical protein